MSELTVYRASDRRIYYNGPCSDLSKERDHTEYLFKRMKKADPTSSCTYFPMEGKFLVFVNSDILSNPDLKGPPLILTGNFHYDKQLALIEAITILEKHNVS